MECLFFSKKIKKRIRPMILVTRNSEGGEKHGKRHLRRRYLQRKEISWADDSPDTDHCTKYYLTDHGNCDLD